MVRLLNALQAWGSPQFAAVFKAEVVGLEKHVLPLQAGLAHSSYVSESPIDAIVLNTRDAADSLLVKTAIFYTGVNSGSCCADDPTPMCEENEYCELQFDIDKHTGIAVITLL